jgi:hypothetical protein
MVNAATLHILYALAEAFKIEPVNYLRTMKNKSTESIEAYLLGKLRCFPFSLEILRTFGNEEKSRILQNIKSH